MCSLNCRTGTDGPECGNGQAPIHHQDWENNCDGMLHWWCMRHITCVHGRQCFTHTHTDTHTFIHQGSEMSHVMATQKQEQAKETKIGCSQNDSLFIHSTSTCMKGLWCDGHRCRCWRQQWDMRMSTLAALCSSRRQKINGDNRQSVKMWKVLRKKQKTLRLSTGIGSVGGKMVKKDDQERLHWDSDMWAENLQEERRSKFYSSLGKGMPQALKGQDPAKGRIGRGHAQVTPRKSGGQKDGGPSAGHVGPQRP